MATKQVVLMHRNYVAVSDNVKDRKHLRFINTLVRLIEPTYVYDVILIATNVGHGLQGGGVLK